jgi:NAD(P)-dependent dehydrogenase (short-subunit alcohol dehydrogenase family)
VSNILITGANRGIGLASARRYLMAGDRVFASCRAPSSAAALQELAAGSKGRVTIHAINVCDAAIIEVAALVTSGIFMRAFQNQKTFPLINQTTRACTTHCFRT